MADTPRPGAVTAMGILNLLFGGGGLLCGLCAGVAGGGVVYLFGNLPAARAGEPDLKALVSGFDGQHPTVKVFLVVSLVLSILLYLMLAVSGIGLLKLRPWGRRLAIVAAAGLIVFMLASETYLLVEGNAALLNFFKEMMELSKQQAQANNQPPPMTMPLPPDTTGNSVQGVVTTLVEMAYPILLIWIMMLKSVRQAFAGGPPGADIRADPDRGWGEDERS